MPTSLVLVEGESVDDQSLMISLANAKQIVIGRAPDYGHLVHIAQGSRSRTSFISPKDLEAALRDIAGMQNVTGVVMLANRLSR
jgi:hypothetical protein